MQKRVSLYFLFFFGCFNSTAQISFETPDTVCVGEIFSIINTASPNQNFTWSFCERDLTTLPEISTFEVDYLDRPTFMDVKKDGENYYGFVTSLDNQLIRLDFGNSLMNTPQVVNLSYLPEMFFGMEGIQLLYEENHWWGVIVGGLWNERLIRLDFGNSLQNIPTIKNFGNIAELAFPHDLYFEKNGNSWYGITINRWSGSSISVISFEGGAANNPSGLNIGNFGEMDNPTGFSLVKKGNLDYSLFVINTENATLSRIDFGATFSGTPSGVNLGNLGLLDIPRDVIIFQQCENYYGYVLDSVDSRLIWLDFGSDISSTPAASVLLENDEWEYPHSFSSFIKEENSLILFMLQVKNQTVTRFRFPTCSAASIPFFVGAQPPPIFYKNEGTHLIQIIANEGTVDEVHFCKEIVVLPKPDLELGKDTVICNGERFSLSTQNPETIWQGQEVQSSIDISETGIYTAQINGDQCSSYDSIFVEFIDCKECLFFPNAFTPDDDLVNDFFQPIIECPINFTSFEFCVFNRWGQKVFQTEEPTRGWDGKFNGKNSTSDVYVWKIKYSYLNNNQEVEKVEFGDVTLIR